MLWTLLALVFVVAILFQLLRKVVQPKIVEYDFLDSNVSSSGHHFVTIATDVHGQYCSLCENGVQTGMQCEYCGVLVDTVLCLRLLAGTMSCKTIPHLTDNDITHHWIRGNLPSSSVCFSCDEMCGDGVGLIDYRCSLCQITVHADCKFSIGERCNLGANRDFIIPPDCINWHKGGYRRKRQLIIDAISMPKKESFSSWTPLFVIVNPKSGGAEGAAVLKTFRYFLHPVQVINIEQVSVGSALRWTDTHPEIDYLVLVAGGDGTVSLILNSLEVLRKRPPVAVLPLGTGNDLSRVLGWGSGHSGEIDFGQVCSSLRESKIVKLDRWTVEITHRRRFGVRPKNKHLRMINYISIGVDACVTYGMQSARNSLPKILSSRFLNKLLFFTFGTKDLLEHSCANLEQKLEVCVDGNIIPLPSVEGLIILNIPSWGAGVRPWGKPADMPQYLNDQMFEVFAVRSSFHIAQLQVGVSEPVRVAQGRKIMLRLFDSMLPMQCDGEAWIQSPAVIEVTHRDQVDMLRFVQRPSVTARPVFS